MIQDTLHIYLPDGIFFCLRLRSRRVLAPVHRTQRLSLFRTARFTVRINITQNGIVYASFYCFNIPPVCEPYMNLKSNPTHSTDKMHKPQKDTAPAVSSLFESFPLFFVAYPKGSRGFKPLLPASLWIRASLAYAPLRSSHAQRNLRSLHPAPRALAPVSYRFESFLLYK